MYTEWKEPRSLLIVQLILWTFFYKLLKQIFHLLRQLSLRVKFYFQLYGFKSGLTDNLKATPKSRFLLHWNSEIVQQRKWQSWSNSGLWTQLLKLVLWLCEPPSLLQANNPVNQLSNAVNQLSTSVNQLLHRRISTFQQDPEKATLQSQCFLQHRLNSWF